jgi:hypothetical protein
LAKIVIQAAGQRFEGLVLFLLRFDIEDKIVEIVVLPEDVRSLERILGS